MTPWREGSKVRNVHLGSCKKLDHQTALKRAREMKAAVLGMSLREELEEEKKVE